MASLPAAPPRRRPRRRLAVAAAVLMVAPAAWLARGPAAAADPSATDWYRLRMCESSNRYDINTGNGYYGAYQFDLPTWQSVGGRGYPNQASPGEQDARALILYRMRGWQPWECAGIVGLREDADARSGRTSDIRVPGGPAPQPTPRPTPPPRAGSAPAWPGPRYFSAGDQHATIARWQAQLRSRRAPLTISGRMDRATLAVVAAVQRQNGLPSTGLLGPVTWRLAWEGRYTAPASPVRSGPAATAPTWPGPRYFSVNDDHATIARWQQQMERRGADLGAATGYFGPRTLAAVMRIQKLNGLPQTGLLGPVTWRLAWTGRF